MIPTMAYGKVVRNKIEEEIIGEDQAGYTADPVLIIYIPYNNY